MYKHLPKGKWTKELLANMSWKELSSISRYVYKKSKKRAKKRIHKLERAKFKKELNNGTET